VAVLSVDLAHRRWSDLGIVVLDRARPERPSSLDPLTGTQPRFGLNANSILGQPDQPSQPPISCEIISWNTSEADPECEIAQSAAPAPKTPSLRGYKAPPVDPGILAGRLNHLCNLRGIRIILLDGPQAWKSTNNSNAHARASERQLNTAAKTGLPGMVKPVSMRAYAEFCLDVYDALSRRGWKRLDVKGEPGSALDRVLIESNPSAAWKALDIKPLPAKRKTRVIDLAERYSALRSLIPLTTDRPPNHDQLQAIVAGLPGLALDEHDTAGARIVGNPPRREEGHWREGYIVLPVPPQRGGGIRWLESAAERKSTQQRKATRKGWPFALKTRSAYWTVGVGATGAAAGGAEAAGAAT